MMKRKKIMSKNILYITRKQRNKEHTGWGVCSVITIKIYYFYYKKSGILKKASW